MHESIIAVSIELLHGAAQIVALCAIKTHKAGTALLAQGKPGATLALRPRVGLDGRETGQSAAAKGLL